jgi:Luciferase
MNSPMTLTGHEMFEQVVEIVSGWPEVESSPHRFGGVEWRLGQVEIGHAHRGGLVDVPYTVRIRNLLVAEGRAEPHHILPDSGWISFFMRQDGDVERATWLLQLSYAHKGLRRLPGVDFAAVVESLKPSEEVRRLLLGVSGGEKDEN